MFFLSFSSKHALKVSHKCTSTICSSLLGKTGSLLGAGIMSGALMMNTTPLAQAADSPLVTATQTQTLATQEQLLLLMGEAKMLKLPRHAKTIFVADPAIASYQAPSSAHILVFGRQFGQTSLYAMDEQGETIYSASVVVGVDSSRIQKEVSQHFPAANIQLTSNNAGLVLKGTVSSQLEATQVLAMVEALLPQRFMETAAQGGASQGNNRRANATGVGRGLQSSGFVQGKITNLLRVLAPNQVNVRVRIAEVSKDVIDQFEFSWNPGKLSSDALAVSPLSAISQSFSTLNSLGGDFISEATGVVDILAEENLLTLLAEPNLTVKSGEPAFFHAGGSISVPIDDGNGGTQFEELNFGVRLQVTPTILSGNRISMKIRPEISELTNAGAALSRGTPIPAIDLRTAETTVELASGQSFALAGMLRSNVVDTVSKVPWLGDVPVLGKLFQSKQFINRETELVMVATVHLVQPTSAPLGLPTDSLVYRTPFERLIWSGSLKPQDNNTVPELVKGLGDFKL